MARPCQRVRLESGLKLDLNRLVRREYIRPGARTGPFRIWWTDGYSGEKTASGIINADMRNPVDGWFQIQIDRIDQRILLVSDERHFGGRQWYFRCPYLNRRASVLWRPPGARDFSCRQRWGRQVAYVSQFMTSTDRAHRGKTKINSRLCSAGGFEPDEWEFPPKPKWMRWHTYERAEEKFDRYEMILNQGLGDLIARLGPI